MATRNSNRSPTGQELQAAEATKQAQLADVSATNIGSSGVTAVPGSVSANDDVQPLGATAAVPVTDTPEAVRDDAAASSTRARLRLPTWFQVLWSNRKARVGLILLLTFFLMALLAPVLAPYDPHDASFMPGMPPSREHLLGTTQAGQDVFSQLIWGARTSLW